MAKIVESGFGKSESAENRELQELRELVEACILEARTRISDLKIKNIEGEPDREFIFHNWEHTEAVMRRAETILRAIQQADPNLVSERDILVAKLAAAWHDVVQDQDEPEEKLEGEKKFGKIDGFEDCKYITLQRKTGNNEKASFDKLNKFIKLLEQVKPDRKRIFEEEFTAQEAIEATIPEWDIQNKTVSQTSFKKNNGEPEMGLVPVAVALADLGAAGMDGAKVFEQEGKKLFREEQIDIANALEKGVESIPQKYKDYYKERMLRWLSSQIDFTKGRENRLKTELEVLPESVRPAVEKLFDKFDQSIENAQEKYKEVQKMNFEELAEYMGYEV